MSEVQEIRKPSKLKLTYIVTAVAISCLMVGASLSMILTATTPTTPTIIEPGSMVSTADYIIFKDGSDIYVKNGTTGAIATFSTNALTVFNWVISRLPSGGTIFVHEGAYTLATPLYIDNPGIIINGAVGPNTDEWPYDISGGARLIGPVTIRAPNNQLNNLGIEGKLTYTSQPLAGITTGMIATYASAFNIFAPGGVDIIGLPGAVAWQVPFNIDIDSSYLAGTSPTNALNLTSGGAGVQHIYIRDSVIVQIDAGSVVDVTGSIFDVVISNTLFNTHDATAILNFTGGGNVGPFQVINSMIEMNDDDDQVVVSIGAGADANELVVALTDCWEHGASQARYIVRDASTAAPNLGHDVIFTRFYDLGTIRFYAAGAQPSTQIYFNDCFFHPTATFEQVHGAYIGKFVNTVGVTGRPVYAAFSGPDSGVSVISWKSSYSQNATPTNNTLYTVRDSSILITVAGGTGVNMTIQDPTGSVIHGYLTTLTNWLLPYGFKITFGAFTVAPSVGIVLV